MSDLALATKANLLTFFRYLGRSPSTEYLESPPLARWHTRMGHPWFDGVISAGAAPADAPALIQASVDYFRAQGVGVFTWWLDPEHPAHGWDVHLRAAGFGYESQTPGMAINLDAVDMGVPLPPGLQISTVADYEALRSFISAAVAGYDIPRSSEQDFLDLVAGLGLELPIRHFVGTLAGKPVATSSLFVAAGVAGVQFVSTIPEARGQGIAAAMTRTALQAAQALGCGAAILQSTDMGYRVYERLGFVRVSNVDNYFFKNGE